MNKGTVIALVKYLIGWPLSLVGLIFVGKILLQHTLSLSQLLHANIFLIAFSLLSFFLYFILRILFWQRLTRQKGVTTDFVDTAFIWSMSEIKRYTPGNIWSFIGRTQSYEQHTITKKTLAHLLILEIFFLLVGSITVSLLSTNFIFYGLLSSFPLQKFVVPLVISLTAFVIIFFVVGSRFGKQLPYIGRLLPQFSIQENSMLFFIMSFAFLFFGLGTYFSVSALSFLYLPHILSLSGFFVCTYIIGYLSFITPMGLGVREGIMTIGLSKYLPLFEAAGGALFSRIILIISEIVFLAFVVVAKRIKKTKLFMKTHTLVKKYIHEILLSIFIITYSLYFTATSFLRYINFYTGRFDLGNMDQTVWNTIHGRIFQLTNPDGTTVISRLAFHADFILVLLSPLYYIWQDPRMLLLIQTLTLASGAIFVYLIGISLFKKKPLPLVFSLAYLLHPAINHANLFDFHGVTLAIVCLLAGWYFIIKHHYKVAVLFLLIAGTTKEEVWLLVGMFGILFMLRKQKVLGLFLALFSFSFFYYLFFKAIPLAHGGNHFALSYYSDFGSTPGGIIKNIFLSPLKILSLIFQNGRLWYLFELFFPFGFLSIFSPLFLLFAGPDLAVSLLSQNSQLHNIYFHYGSIPTPFILLSAMYGVQFLQRKFPQISTYFLCVFLLTTSSIAAYWYGPLPGAKNMDHAMYTEQLVYRQQVDAFLRTIPKRYSVAATNNIGSHLSHRQRIYTIPLGIDTADVIVFLLNDQFAQPSLKTQKEFVQELSNDPRYIKVYEYGDFVLFTKKGLPLRPLRNTNTFTPPIFH